MSEIHLPIVVDQREKGRIIQRLEGLEGVELTQVDRELGDYLLPGDVMVERKSATDLILSVVDGTLWEKVAKLKSQHQRVVYIVEGDLYAPRFHQQALDVHRALAMMVITHGVSVLPSADADHSGMLIYLLGLAGLEGHNADAGRRETPRIRRDAQLHLLGSLPEIDTDHASALLRAFGSARAALAADSAALAAVDGVEPETATRICEILDHRG